MSNVSKETFYTLEKEAQSLYEIKRSRFIGYAMPVETVKEAQDFISRIKALNRDARHNVYAYTVVENGNTYTKYSDDGEPQGTAGLPLLNSIQKKEIENAVIVVTRYFGGILLGAPGLLRAYTTAASEALELAGRKKKVLCRKIIVEADYKYISGLINIFASQELHPQDSKFTDKATFVILSEISKIEKLCYNIKELTSDNANVEIGEYEYK
ncbi:MAG: YigZ family protein [Clostridia bacterium]|nr:YigZ family protein [Clostridia bacterium]